MKGNKMKKTTKDSEVIAEYLLELGEIALDHESRIKKIGRLLFMSIVGFSALGTYLVVKNQNK
jgi:hypothetical protein